MTIHPETIKSLSIIKQKTENRKKTVLVCGKFNIVHPGHLRLLRFASECGDYLAVGIIEDETENNNPALLNEQLRLESVKAISWVDYAFILREPPEKFIRKMKPSIVVKGKEHENYYNPEYEAVKAYGGKLVFSSGDINFSLAELLQDDSNTPVTSPILKQDAFIKRHGFNWRHINDTLNAFSNLKVAVLGEIIVDEYINCDPIGMSREDPTIVVTPVAREKYVGGAGIVAAHAANLGAEVNFFSITGCDDTAEFAKQKLSERGVHLFSFQDDTRPTILKQRFRSSGKTLLRVNNLRSHPISRELQTMLINNLLKIIDNTNLVIFADFNYGILPQPMVENIIEHCRRRDIMMVADSQSSSQIGDVSRFVHMQLLTPTEREARLAVRDFESGLVVLAEKLRQKACAKNVFITLDKDGMLIHAGNAEDNQWQTDKLQAMNPSPRDPAGAGDSLLTCSALASACGADIWTSAYLGSLAAACQVERIGNIPISIADIMIKLPDNFNM